MIHAVIQIVIEKSKRELKNHNFMHFSVAPNKQMARSHRIWCSNAPLKWSIDGTLHWRASGDV